MRTFFKLLPLMVTVAAVNACSPYKPDPLPEYHPPDLTIKPGDLKLDPETTEFFKKAETCDNKQQPLTKDLQAKPYPINATIPMQTVESIDCSGKQTSKDLERVTPWESLVVISAPNLSKTVKKAEVQNLRTCKSTDLVVGQVFGETSKMSEDGKIELDVNDLTLVIGDVGMEGMPVREGDNVIQVKYLDESGAEIGSQSLDVLVHLNQVDTGKTIQKKQCN